VQPLGFGPQLRRRLDSRHAVAALGKGCGVAAGPSADVDDLAGRRGKEMQDVGVDVGEADALVLLYALGGGLAVASVPLGRPFMSSAAAVAVGNETSHCVDQRIEVVTKHNPDKVEAHVAVAVDEPVAHAGDFSPWDIGMRGFGGSRDSASRLAQNLQ